MWKNYFVAAWRHLLKNKASAALNIGGLAIGMATTLLIGIWIWDEWSYDTYHLHYNKIAQVMQHQTLNGEVHTQTALPVPLGAALRTQFETAFERVVLSSRTAPHVLSVGERQVIRTGRYMEAAAPTMFSLRMVSGSSRGLADPSSVLLSTSTAAALFGQADPVNKTVVIDDTTTLRVAGVYEDLPGNTTLTDVQFLMPWTLDASARANDQNWDNNGWQIYVQVANSQSAADLSTRMTAAALIPSSDPGGTGKRSVFLHPMRRWHLYSEFKNGVNAGGRIAYVRLFGLIGLCVLVLACINFMNLSTASSEKRSREVGVRKAVGSGRRQLIFQFYAESFLVTLLAFGVSLVLLVAVLPFFNTVAGKQLSILWGAPGIWMAGLGISIAAGVLAGSYPALYLSSFQPVKVLKGRFKAGKGAVRPRQALVVVQFAVSIMLMIGTIVVFRQIHFAKQRPVGYSREGLVTIETLTPDIPTHFAAFRNDLVQSGAVQEAAISSTPITESNNEQGNFDWRGKDARGSSQNFATVGVSQTYGKTIGWQLVAGRGFQTGPDGADAMGFVLNESAARMMGFDKPVGENVQWTGYQFTVLGVVKDMVMQSPFDPVMPTIFFLAPWQINVLNIRIHPQKNIQEAIGQIKKVYQQYVPGQPFTVRFVDDDYARKFAIEERVGTLVTFFTTLAFLISCLGMLGMASFMAEQRTKEIGVRKVLGASVINLWGLLSRDFVLLVGVSCLVAIPAAWYGMHQWLQQYTYKTSLSWWIFGATAAGALLLALLTVSFQTIRAARANPVRTLRTD